MGAKWDAERGAKAAVWFFFYVLCWLLMQLSCEIGLPSNCRRGYEPMDVLMELPFLLAFSLGQAFLCDILDSSRYEGLSKRLYFPAIVVGSGVITSALLQSDGFVDLQESEEDLTAGANVASVLLIIAVGLVFLYHFFLAFKRLPGAVMISGGVTPTVDETAQAATGNRFAQYASTTTMILAYVALYAVFAYRRGDGWDYHHIILAWVLSLIASFDDFFSVLWLGITTGVFLQGVGAHSFQFIFHAAN